MSAISDLTKLLEQIPKRISALPVQPDINVKSYTLRGVVAGIVVGILWFAFVFAPDNDLPSKNAWQIGGFIVGSLLGPVFWLGLIGFAYARSINHYNRVRAERK